MSATRANESAHEQKKEGRKEEKFLARNEEDTSENAAKQPTCDIQTRATDATHANASATGHKNARATKKKKKTMRSLRGDKWRQMSVCDM